VVGNRVFTPHSCTTRAHPYSQADRCHAYHGPPPCRNMKLTAAEASVSMVG